MKKNILYRNICQSICKNSIARNFIDSFIILRENISYVVFPVFSDLVFLILFGTLFSYFYNRILELIYSIGSVFVAGSGGEQAYSADIINLLSTQAMPSVKKMIILVVAFFLLLYILYCIIQGISWKLCHNLSGTRSENRGNSMHVFIKKFFAVNILWLSLFALYSIITYFLDLRATIMTGSLEKSSIAPIFLVVIIYFAFISYSLIRRYKAKASLKRTFSTGIKKAYSIIPVYLAITAVFLLIDLIMLIPQSKTAVVALGIVLFLPAVTWARVFLILSVSEQNEVE